MRVSVRLLVLIVFLIVFGLIAFLFVLGLGENIEYFYGQIVNAFQELLNVFRTAVRT